MNQLEVPMPLRAMCPAMSSASFQLCSLPWSSYWSGTVFPSAAHSTIFIANLMRGVKLYWSYRFRPARALALMAHTLFHAPPTLSGHPGSHDSRRRTARRAVFACPAVRCGFLSAHLTGPAGLGCERPCRPPEATPCPRAPQQKKPWAHSLGGGLCRLREPTASLVRTFWTNFGHAHQPPPSASVWIHFVFHLRVL